MAEHPFAQYIRILGKGKSGSRALSRDEACAAMSMIYCYDVEPEQLGAFMMLMRVKEETADELAGFVDAMRASIPAPAFKPDVSIDWPCYAGKRRQLPWFVLAALLLSRHGYPVFMHGLSRDDERVYARQALKELGIAETRSLSEATARLQASGFAYIDIDHLSPLTSELLNTRELLGLRSPMHTAARMLNPFNAELSLQPVFHPNYAEIHQAACSILIQPRSLSFKGEGGEAERVPERSVSALHTLGTRSWKETWPSLIAPDKHVRDDFPNWDHYREVWQKVKEDSYAMHAVSGTIALVLRSMDETLSHEQALAHGRSMWEQRATVAEQKICG